MNETFEGGCEAAFYTNYRQLLSGTDFGHISGRDLYKDTTISQNLDKLIATNGENSQTFPDIIAIAKDSKLNKTESSPR
jgi:hypothetical protein